MNNTSGFPAAELSRRHLSATKAMRDELDAEYAKGEWRDPQRIAALHDHIRFGFNAARVEALLAIADALGNKQRGVTL